MLCSSAITQPRCANTSGFTSKEFLGGRTGGRIWGILSKFPGHPRSTNLARLLLSSLRFLIPPLASCEDGVALREWGDQREGRRTDGRLCRRLHHSVGLWKEEYESASTMLRREWVAHTAVFPSHTSRDKPDIVRFLLEFTLRNLRDGITLVSDGLRSRSRALCCIGGTLTGLGNLFLDRD